MHARWRRAGAGRRITVRACAQAGCRSAAARRCGGRAPRSCRAACRAREGRMTGFRQRSSSDRARTTGTPCRYCDRRGRPGLHPRPPISTLPLVTSNRPAMPFSSVDLPQPEGPSSTRNSPLATSSDRSSMIGVPDTVIDRLRMETADTGQPLIAPVAMPRMNQRPAAKYNTSGTSAVRIVAAMLTL